MPPSVVPTPSVKLVNVSLRYRTTTPTAFLVLFGCATTSKQVKQAHWDCRERNYDAAEVIGACTTLLATYQAPESEATYLAARGVAYGRQDRTGEAMADLDRALEMQPSAHHGQAGAREARAEGGQSRRRPHRFNQVLAEGPWLVDALIARAKLNLDAGKFDAAIHDLTEAIALRPERSDAWLQRATAYRRVGN